MENRACSYAHIGQAVRSLAVTRANLPVTICNGRVQSGRQFLRNVTVLVYGLRYKLGLREGDRVAIAALNSEWYLEWLLAVPSAGGIIAPLNYRWSILEACEAVRQIDPTVLVFDQHCADLGCEIKRMFPNIKLLTLGYSTPGVDRSESILNSTQQEPQLFWAPDGIALICFTSGTTGKPKGAAISHHALIIQSLAKIAMVNYSSTDIYLHASPLCHIGGISSAHAMILAGGCHVFLPKFQHFHVLNTINEYQVTAVIVVPTMLKDLTMLIQASHERAQWLSITTILNGAGSLSSHVLEKTIQLFPNARILSAYGMTEACSSMTFFTLYDRKVSTNKSIQLNVLQNETNSSSLGGFCVGKPAPHVDILVRGKSNGNNCVNEEGNVLVRGPHMMDRYWGEIKNPFDNNGWFDTGDLGWMDHLGQIWLLGRSKDVIKSGGENVYCYEVEEILSRHPGVAVAAVAGVDDARFGEIVGALLLLKNGWKWEDDFNKETNPLDLNNCANQIDEERTVSAKSMYLHCCKQGLSRYKIPRIWCNKTSPFVTTSTGKIRKDAVKEELAAYSKMQLTLSRL